MQPFELKEAGRNRAFAEHLFIRGLDRRLPKNLEALLFCNGWSVYA